MGYEVRVVCITVLVVLHEKRRKSLYSVVLVLGREKKKISDNIGPLLLMTFTTLSK